MSAWRLLLAAEQKASKLKLTADRKASVTGIRVLALFLKDFWEHKDRNTFGLTPYKRLLLELFSCYPTDDDEDAFQRVRKLGLQLRSFLLGCFRSDAGPILTPSEHPSRPSFENFKEKVLVSMAEAPKSLREAKRQALQRDGNRCVISGCYDMTLVSDFEDLATILAQEKAATTDTECAHIFPQSAQDGSNPPEHAATAFAMMQLFGLGDVAQGLLGSRANTLANVMTMSHNIHRQFDTYKFWLEAVDSQPHTYDVRSHEMTFFRLIDKPRERITLQVDPEVVVYCESHGIPVPPLPNPALIALRATCARVANMSGAVEEYDDFQDDRASVDVLKTDGSSADILAAALLIKTLA